MSLFMRFLSVVHSRTWVACILCMPCIACTASVALAQTTAPVAVITFDRYPIGDDLLTVHASVTGHAGTFLFDTGEGVSMISSELAKAIGCKPWGRISGFRMLGDRVDAPHCDGIALGLEGQRLNAPSVIVYDLMKLFPADAPRLDGSLGLDLFAGRAITLELARRTLTVENQRSLAVRVAHATEVPIRIVRDAEGLALSTAIGVTTPAGTAWMELDSGSVGIIVSSAIASLLNLDPQSKGAQPVRFTIGGRVPVVGSARVVDGMIMDGILGMSCLEKWTLTLDLVSGRAWIAPAV
jgi:hypothetical protein